MINVTIQGMRPLLMHNGRLSDPLDPWTVKLAALTKKQKKAVSDHHEIARTEFEGGLYHDPKLGPFLPVDNLQAMLVEGARKRKLGKEFESLIEVVVPDAGPQGYAITYKGPRDPESMWTGCFFLRKGAVVSGKRVVRTRPRFPTGWRCAFQIEVLEGGPSAKQIEQSLSDAGRLIGIGDWTPRYGRFVVEAFKE